MVWILKITYDGSDMNEEMTLIIEWRNKLYTEICTCCAILCSQTIFIFKIMFRNTKLSAS